MSEETPGILNVDVNEATDPTLLPDAEYELSIISAEVKTSQKGNEYLNLRMNAPAEPMAEDVYHILMLPTGDQDPKQANRYRLAFRDFYSAAGIPTEQTLGLDIQVLVGLQTWALIGTEQSDPSYPAKNVVKRFITSKS